MNNNNNLCNLHAELIKLLKRKKIHIKSAIFLSYLDIDAEQLWVLRFYSEHGILPKIKQSQLLKEACEKKRLTLKVFQSIMETSLKPQKTVFDYSDFVPLFFEVGTPPEQIKRETLKILTYWKNNRK